MKKIGTMKLTISPLQKVKVSLHQKILDKYCNNGGKMVVKVDKSKEFVKSGKILVSEYPAIHPKSIKTKKSE